MFDAKKLFLTSFWRLSITTFIFIYGLSLLIYAYPKVGLAYTQNECYALGGACGWGTCTPPATSIGTCDYAGITLNCCRAGGPPVPPGTTAIPDTNCPADSTYVALTDSCISVSDFNNFLFNLLILAGVLVAIYRATTGFFMFMTAEGSPEKLQSGREALTQAMVGLLIVVAGWVFIRLFETILPDAWNIILTGA